MTPWGALILAAIALWLLLASLKLVAVFAVPILFAGLCVAIRRPRRLAGPSGGQEQPQAQDAPAVRPARALVELDGLTGLDGVKAEVTRLVDLLQIETERLAHGLGRRVDKDWDGHGDRWGGRAKPVPALISRP